MIKMGFSTNAVDGWPPFEFEHIWLERISNCYKVMNTPFYVKGICYEDEITFKTKDGLYVESWSIERESDNSTIWIMEIKNDSFRKKLKQVQSLGCIVENGVPPQYYSVTLPGSIDIDEFGSIIMKDVRDGRLSVSYATMRRCDPTIGI